MTIHDRLEGAAAALIGVSDAPHLDAERILLFTIGQSESSWLYAHGEMGLSAEQEDRCSRLVQERVGGRPLAYVLGEWDFFGRTFAIDEGVLVPRPETEALVQAALARIASLRRQLGRPVRVADIGTGSGCIAVTVALEAAADEVGQIVATDISGEALAVARQNAARHGVEGRIDFRQGDMLAPLRGALIDLIVSNPPYVPTAALAESVRQPTTHTAGLAFEPQVALDGGADGTRFIQELKGCGLPVVLEGPGGRVLQFG